MKTPKEKAEELIERFKKPTTDIHGKSYKRNKQVIKWK